MPKLELKIPPVLVTVIFALLIWLLSILLPGIIAPNRLRFGVSSIVIILGIYKKTRNPMYVGFLFFLIGWGLFLSNLFSLALCAGFVLKSLFGEEFLTYKSQVRRWL